MRSLPVISILLVSALLAAEDHDGARIEREAFAAGGLAAQRTALCQQAHFLMELAARSEDPALKAFIMDEMDGVLIQWVQLERTPFVATASYRELEAGNQATWAAVLVDIQRFRSEVRHRHESPRAEELIGDMVAAAVSRASTAAASATRAPVAGGEP